MEPFSRIDLKYRDFQLAVNVDQTVFGFTKGDRITFRQYSPGEKIKLNSILAVSRPGEQQLVLGQHIRFKWDRDESTHEMLRMWNEEVGRLYRDFDIHGFMIMPSQKSWEERRKAGLGVQGRLCPLENPRLKIACGSAIKPCRPYCPYLSFIGLKGPTECDWEVKRALFTDSGFVQPVYSCSEPSLTEGPRAPSPDRGCQEPGASNGVGQP